jgi:hypothetical protein
MHRSHRQNIILSCTNDGWFLFRHVGGVEKGGGNVISVHFDFRHQQQQEEEEEDTTATIDMSEATSEILAEDMAHQISESATDESTPLLTKTKEFPDPSKDKEDEDNNDKKKSLYLPFKQHLMASRGKVHWNKLEMRVNHGDLLLGIESPESQHHTRRSALRKKKQLKIRGDMSFTATQCVCAILLYQAFSILVYTFVLEPEWSMIDSLYFSVVTFTTVGYGDITPSSEASKLFTCVFALVGVSCLGLALGNLGANLMSAEENALLQREETARYEAMTLFEDRSSPVLDTVGEDADVTMVVNSNNNPSLLYKGKKLPMRKSPTFLRFVPLVPPMLIIVILAYVIGYAMGWNLVSTIYYLIITGKSR